MRHLTALLLAVLLCITTGLLAQKKLVIIGSSTAACTNVNSVTECYVGLLNSWYNQQAPFDTVINGNLALGGTNCYNGMPTSYISPYTSPYMPDPARNITAALAEHPDVVLVNYPTNGYDLLRVDSILYCLRTIRDSANIKGVPCYVTTTQPRTNPGSFNTSAIKAKLAELKDSILLEFGHYAIDFYTGLINPADSSILYDSGDHIHMNAMGHNIMFQRIVAKNIFLSGTGGALPASFLQFNTINKNNTNIVKWITARETAVDYYEIQRSNDGSSFSRIGRVAANNSFGNSQYQYTDDQPAKGWNYYKIIIVDRDGKKHASPVMSIHSSNGKTGIIKTFVNNAAQVVVTLQTDAGQNIQLRIMNNMGILMSREARKIDAGTSTLYLQTPALSNGIYHVQVTTAAGETMLGSFIKNQ
jgi:hypothetical protein